MKNQHPVPFKVGDIVKQIDIMYGEVYYYLILSKTDWGYDVLELEGGDKFSHGFEPHPSVKYEIV